MVGSGKAPEGYTIKFVITDTKEPPKDTPKPNIPEKVTIVIPCNDIVVLCRKSYIFRVVLQQKSAADKLQDAVVEARLKYLDGLSVRHS